MRSVLKSQKNKKAQLGNLQGIILALVVVGILLGAAFLILDEFQQQTTPGSTAEAAVNQTQIALLTVPNLLGLIVLIAIVGIILQIVFNVIPGARATA